MIAFFFFKFACDLIPPGISENIMKSFTFWIEHQKKVRMT